MDFQLILQKLIGVPSDFYLTRFVFQRALGFTYLVAFLVVINQFRPLLGEKGLLPVSQFVTRIRFWDAPSLFYFFPKDQVFMLLGWLGLILAIIATVGLSERFSWGVSAAVWFLLWVIYLSFINVGQTFYAFGWESMLLEAGFIAIFLGSYNTAPSVLTIVLIRWMLFRVMFGAGMIKLRGDPCWRDLTCLTYHHETQPMPNPLSWYFHHSPVVVHKLGVLYNHFVELVIPFFYFAPPPLSIIAGVLTLVFHGILFVSGNYAFLGSLTMVLAIATFNDNILSKIIPISIPAATAVNTSHQYAVYTFAILVAVLSVKPFVNLFSPFQAMNRSFEPLHLVNTYGAFGSVTKKRYEVVIEATTDEMVSDQSHWREYEFKAKPTDISRSPPQYAPYHLRLDWLMWFEGIYAGEGMRLGGYGYSRWFVKLMQKLLVADRDTLSLIKSAPFGDKQPTAVRALIYHYQFTNPQERQKTGSVWKRTFIDTYIPPITLDTLKY